MVLGNYEKIVSAKTNKNKIFKHAQDGGIITSLLIYALEEHLIDGALVATSFDDEWIPTPIIATTADEILESAGTKYSLCPSISAIKDVVKESNLEKIAAVLTPCQCQSIRKIQKYPLGGNINILKFIFGVFCMRTFSHEAIEQLCKKLGVELKDVKRMDVAHGHFYLNSWDEGLRIPLKEIHEFEQRGCDVCKDYSALFSDLAFGTAGSPTTYSTVVLRTKKGLDLFNSAVDAGLIKYDPIEEVSPGLPLLEIRGEAKESQANEEIKRRKQKGMFVPRIF